MKFRLLKALILLCFIFYIIVLLKIVMFKHAVTIHLISDFDWAYIRRNSNFIPFKTIINYLFKSDNVRISMVNLLGNILIFLPFGLILPLLSKLFMRYWAIVFSAFITSLLMETSQLFLGLGSFDVDDLILNTVGAFIGFIFISVSSLIKSRASQ